MLQVNASPRRRAVLATMLVGVVAAGLASRRFPFLVPGWLGKYPGDALWAWMILLGLAALRPQSRRWSLALVAYGVCVVVECSQRYHAPWIDAIRATRLGHLALGSGFDPTDLLAYAIGIVVGWAADRLVFPRTA